MEGPLYSGGYSWWKIDYTSGADGYSADIYLETTTSVFTPGPTTPTPPKDSNTQTVEAENYVNYKDNDPLNNGATIRNDGVDISGSATTGYAVGWFEAGEWLEYSINAPKAGSYAITLHMASPGDGGSVGVSVDGQDIGTISVPNTGSYTSFTPISLSTTLSAGAHTLRISGLKIGTMGYVGDLNKIDVTYKDTSSTPSQTTQTTGFKIGDRVIVNDGPLSVRQSPSIYGTIQGKQSIGSIGTIIGGSSFASGYNWWRIDYASGADGYSAENFLTLSGSASASSLPQPATNTNPTPSAQQSTVSGTGSTPNVRIDHTMDPQLLEEILRIMNGQ